MKNSYLQDLKLYSVQVFGEGFCDSLCQRPFESVQRLLQQGIGKRLPNYYLVGEDCILVGENPFDLPDLVGENICLLRFYVA